ncbi:iron transporter FeoB, partial [Vibrio xuii]
TGYFSNQHGAYQLVDLPGTYSLTSFSLEERVARKALREENADVVLNVLDAANLNRSLHLTLQLLEMEQPVVLALNMMDVAVTEGIHIDSKKLADSLKVPVAECIGRKGKGIKDIANALTQAQIGGLCVDYPELEGAVAELCSVLEPHQLESSPSRRWLALRLLENDQETQRWLQSVLDEQSMLELNNVAIQQQAQVEQTLQLAVSDYMATQRQKRVSQL